MKPALFLLATTLLAQPADPARGKAIFEGKGDCLSCHRVNGAGSRSGPDLSDIAISRGRGGGPGIVAGGTAAGNAQGLTAAILDPDAEVALINRSVRIVTKDGKTITGRLLNHDNFSVQLRDPQGKLLAFSKSDLREFTILAKSPMPSYKGKLTDDEVADLVAYLMTLKGVPLQ